MLACAELTLKRLFVIEQVCKTVLYMQIPPLPGMIAFALIVSVLYAEICEKLVKANAVIEQIVVVSAPHIQLWKRLAVLRISFSKGIDVVTGAAKLIYAVKVVAENRAPLRDGMMLEGRNIESTGKTDTAAKSLRIGESRLNRAVATHRKSAYKIVLALFGHSAEKSPANRRELLGDEGKIARAVSHISIPASAAVRHYHGNTALGCVTLDRGSALPDRMIVGESVKKI